MWKIGLLLFSKKFRNVCIKHLIKGIGFVKHEIYDHIFQLAAGSALTTAIKKYSTAITGFKAQPYALHLLTDGPKIDLSVTKEDALKFYRQMNTIRRSEQACATLYTEKVIRGFCHLYSGQEAIAVGMHSELSSKDHIITAYRCHGWVFMIGVDSVQIISELTGRQSGVVRGKGGSMHMYGPNFYGGNGIVGAHIPVGMGTAFACKYTNSGGVGVVLYGDGASNQGQFYESLNMSKLWNLPVMYVCENNLYGMGTSINRASSNTQKYCSGASNSVPGIKIDGMDVLAVREVTKWARDYALNKGPIIIEAITYRYFGHSMSDPGTSYRKREEITEVRQSRDPITTFKEKILQKNVVTESELKEIDDAIKIKIEKAIAVARTDKEIDEVELAYDIYSNNLAGKVRNNLPWLPLEHKNLQTPINMK